MYVAKGPKGRGDLAIFKYHAHRTCSGLSGPQPDPYQQPELSIAVPKEGWLRTLARVHIPLSLQPPVVHSSHVWFFSKLVSQSVMFKFKAHICHHTKSN